MAYIIVFCNFIVFLIYGIDKYKAKKHKTRISEKTLILSSFIFGGVGAIIAMYFFHHKTKKLKFKILVPIAAILHIVIYAFYFYPIDKF